jgi:hypothetical protein
VHIQDFDDAGPDNTAGGNGGTMPASAPVAVPAAARLVNPFVFSGSFRGDLIKFAARTKW